MSRSKRVNKVFNQSILGMKLGDGPVKLVSGIAEFLKENPNYIFREAEVGFTEALGRCQVLAKWSDTDPVCVHLKHHFHLYICIIFPIQDSTDVDIGSLPSTP